MSEASSAMCEFEVSLDKELLENQHCENFYRFESLVIENNYNGTVGVWLGKRIFPCGYHELYCEVNTWLLSLLSIFMIII